MIMLVGGRAGEGKTTFVEMCKKLLNDPAEIAVTLPFAEAVKDTARGMGWNGEKDEKGRRLLQVIGGAGREYNSNTWVSIVADKILTLPKEIEYVFIDDWRFPNELIFMKDAFHDDVLSVRIWRRDEDLLLYNTPMWDDPSETSLSSSIEYYDRNINNYGDLDDLEMKARTFVSDILKEKR